MASGLRGLVEKKGSGNQKPPKKYSKGTGPKGVTLDQVSSPRGNKLGECSRASDSRNWPRLPQMIAQQVTYDTKYAPYVERQAG